MLQGREGGGYVTVSSSTVTGGTSTVSGGRYTTSSGGSRCTSSSDVDMISCILDCTYGCFEKRYSTSPCVHDVP